MDQQVDSNNRRATRPVRMVSAKVALAGAVVIAVLSGAVVSYAGGGGPFPDVPGSHPFATEIENMANAGITGGFPDGTFRPDNPVTRASMAAFLGRGLGRTSYRAIPEQEITADATSISLPFIEIAPGAIGSGNNGYVVVTAAIEVDRNSDTCVCSAYIQIQASKNNFANIDFVSDSHSADLDTGMTYTTISHTVVVLVEPGSNYRFRVRANNNVNVLHGTDRTTFSGSMSAIYVPYGWDGTADHIS
jgi:hypothetical protein